MRKALFLLISAFASVNVFADVGGVVVSNEFPQDEIMLENHVYKNAAVFANLGVYSGTIDAVAVYEDIHCDAGYYLPENAEECALCTENHFCIGDGSIESCPEGLVAPLGTTSADLCGKKFGVGDDVMYLTQIKQTSPALAVQIGDKTFYGKATPVSEGDKKININATRSLKMLFNDVEYSIHDNTVD